MRLRWDLNLLRQPMLATGATQPRSRSSQLRFLALAAIVFGLLLWVILAFRPPPTPGLTPNQPSPANIQASRSISYVSLWRTEQERVRAENSPDTIVYQRNSNIPIQQRGALVSLLQSITTLRDDPALNQRDTVARIGGLPSGTGTISETTAQIIVALSDADWASVRQQSLDLYDRALSEHNYALTETVIFELRELSLPYWASLYAASPQRRALIAELAGAALTVNVFRDETATQARRQAARESVKPVIVQILAGETIVREGDIVTPDIQEKLEALDELRTETNWPMLAGRAVIAVMIAALFGVYIGVAQREILASRRAILVIFVLVLINAAAARVLLTPGSDYTYAFPLAALALLFATLFSPALALLASMALSLIVAFVGDGQVVSVMALFLGCAAGIFAIGRGERSLTFFLSGSLVALVLGVLRIGYHLIRIDAPGWVDLTPALLLSGLSGLISAVLALGLYNLTAQLAGIVTPMRLMELGHPARPLLRKLIREAPGTYYHSVAVGNLAESAAEAIGADALLLRVASYYHDIGKTVRPFFFIDNQSNRENVHDELDPTTSAGIIADHVREGVKLADAAGLPQVMIDFIRTHHGTSLISYFYQRALREQDDVDIEKFRYPGPRPVTREQGVMMLADGVEATVRAKMQAGKVVAQSGGRNDGTTTLEELVNSIIDERVRSGQLDACALTMTDLAAIRQAFLQTLHGIHHPRVDYPAPRKEL